MPRLDKRLRLLIRKSIRDKLRIPNNEASKLFCIYKDGKIVLKPKVTEDDAVLCSVSIDSKGRVTIPYNMLYLMNLEIGSEVSIWEFNGIIYIEKLGT